jgi:hypothetical protein
MSSEKSDLFCLSCGERWHMTEYGKMDRAVSISDRTSNEPSVRAADFSNIPDWYEWQRNQVEKEIEEGTYFLNMKVHIEALPNAVNFIDLGDGILQHNRNGFELTFTEYGESENKTLCFPSITMTSIHTEYEYRGKGQCVTLSTADNTYFLFPRGEGFNATKIQFAAEYFYEAAAARNFR